MEYYQVIKTEWNPDIWSKTEETEWHYVKWNELDTGKWIPHVLPYIWEQKNININTEG